MPTHAEAINAIIQHHNNSYPATATYGSWKNFAQNLYKEQALIVQINSISQLSALMKSVDEQNKAILAQNPQEPLIKVRAAAGWRDEPLGNLVGWSRYANKWAREQEIRYNESYSITPPATEGDILVRFSPIFQSKHYKQLGNNEVTVPAGMQIGELATRMHNSETPLSLSTVSMIWAVSAVGLFANDGHGTGTHEGSFPSLVKAIHVIDHQGRYRIIDKDSITECEMGADGRYVAVRESKTNYFDVMRAPNLGLYGIIVKLQIMAKPEFNMRENRYTYHDLDAANRDISLAERMRKPYFTFMWMPADNLLTPNLEFREWHITNDRDMLGAPAFQPGITSRRQDMQIKINKLMNDYIYAHNAEYVLPIIQKMGAQVAIGLKHHTKHNPDVRQGEEYEITHYQVAFPSDLMDISMLFPVDEDKLPAFFEALYNETQRILKSDDLKGKTPITYAVYARLIQGLHNGFSSSATKPGQKILAFEWVTHPDAPGLDVFLLALFTWINKNTMAQPRFHFGKFVPPHATFETFLGKPAVNEMRAALIDYYGSEEAAANSPFMTPYILSKLQPGEGLRLPETLTGVRDALSPYKKAAPRRRAVITADPAAAGTLVHQLEEGYQIRLSSDEKAHLGIPNTELEVTPTCFDSLKKVFC